jgi:hypothetical protein
LDLSNYTTQQVADRLARKRDALPRIFVVLGMHKSGTTLVARTLHQSGIPMVSKQQDGQGSYDQGGTFEWGSFKTINRNLLRSKHRGSLAIDLDRPLIVLGNDLARARTLIAHASAESPVWGFKDPCTTLTYPFWRGLLPAHTIIAIYRSPRGVIAHYARLRNRLIGQSLRHWMKYNEGILEYFARSDTRGILLSFDELMADDAAWRGFAEFLGRPMVDVREPSLYRSRPSSQEPLDDLSAFPRDCAMIWQRLRAIQERQRRSRGI